MPSPQSKIGIVILKLTDSVLLFQILSTLFLKAPYKLTLHPLARYPDLCRPKRHVSLKSCAFLWGWTL